MARWLAVAALLLLTAAKPAVRRLDDMIALGHFATVSEAVYERYHDVNPGLYTVEGLRFVDVAETRSLPGVAQEIRDAGCVPVTIEQLLAFMAVYDGDAYEEVKRPLLYALASMRELPEGQMEVPVAYRRGYDPSGRILEITQGRPDQYVWPGGFSVLAKCPVK